MSCITSFLRHVVSQQYFVIALSIVVQHLRCLWAIGNCPNCHESTKPPFFYFRQCQHVRTKAGRASERHYDNTTSYSSFVNFEGSLERRSVAAAVTL